MRTDRLQREYGVELRWSVFPLHPEIPEEGMEISALFAGREAAISKMQVRLAQQAAAEGLELSGGRSRTYNSRLAQELGKWAESQNKGEHFRHAVYQAFFVEGVNIALVDELAKIAEAAGLSMREARQVLAARGFAGAVDADWHRAKEMRVTAVPTHLCGARRLEGFGPYEDFVRLLGQDI